MKIIRPEHTTPCHTPPTLLENLTIDSYNVNFRISNFRIMKLTAYRMDQRSMLNPTVQAARSCSIQTVNTADCAAPMKLIHVVSDSCAGYLFNVIAYILISSE